MVPSMWLAIIDSLDRKAVKNLRIITLAGEALTEGLVNRCKELNAELEIVNEYGPTENSVVSTIKRNIKANSKITIGKPRCNTKVYILDDKNKLLPIGVVGELCISGEGLARGYINNEVLTAEKFIVNPYEEGQRLYKTGDLAKWLDNGEIEFIGRKDNQVKIRGFRIELGEIENALSKIQGIKEAIVLDIGEAENKYLCAYIVSDIISEEEIRDKLKAFVPDYMIPSYFVNLDVIPLTVNGKVDRKILPAPSKKNKYVAPRSEIEKILTKLWEKVLGAEKIGINDDFFALGGQSIKAMLLTAMINKEFNIDIKLNDVFTKTTINKLAKYIESADGITYEEIPNEEIRDYYEVSAAQKRMLILNKLEGDSIHHNMPIAMLVNGEIDKSSFEEALSKLVKRHEILRTYFKFLNSQPVQIISSENLVKIDYLELKLEELNGYIESFVKVFDLQKGPLLRVSLVKVEKNKYAVIFDMHHIISDAVTVKNLFKELSDLLEGKSLEPIRIQYKDFAAWQNKKLKSDYGKRLENYWLERFKGELPKLNMPLDYQRPAVQSFDGAGISFSLERTIMERLKRLSEETGTTLYMILLSVFNVLLSKYSAQEDIIIATPITGRNHLEIEKSLGMFINTLAMRNYPKPQISFRQFLMEVRENTLNAYDNQEYQFEEFVSKLNIERDISRNPICDVSFNMLNGGVPKLKFGEFEAAQYEFRHKISKYDFSLTAEEREEEIKIELQYCVNLFNKISMERLSEGFINLTKQIIENVDSEIYKLDVNSDKERERILRSFNETELVYEKEKTLSRLFEEQVERTPDLTALECEGLKLTYKELNIRANKLARILRKSGITNNSIVPIMVSRSFDLIAGILGILKSGAAYLPIDTEYPADRVNYMLKDSKAVVILTENNLIEKLEGNCQVIQY